MKYQLMVKDRAYRLHNANSSHWLLLSPIALTTDLLPLRPAGQSNLALLGGVGVAILLIIVLAIIIITLLLVMRSRSKGSHLKETNRTVPSAQVAPRANQADTPTLQSPTPTSASIEESLTVPSISAQEEDADDTDPSLLSIKTIGEPETMPVSGHRPPNINWQIAGLTDVGLKRQLNEDNMIMIETETSDKGSCGLYVVADGMGGHESGEIASQLTINTIQAQFSKKAITSTDDAIDRWLNSAVDAANNAVIAHQKDKNQAKKMGSTLVMALITKDKAHIANVGDSRAYRLTNNSIQQISIDHSLVERLIEIGQITREEARTHKQRNVIYSTIGDKANPQIGTYQVDLQPGDRLLLCSDGLTGMLTDEQILNISRSHASPVEACQMLVKAANAAGGEDNITAIIVEMSIKEDKSNAG